MIEFVIDAGAPLDTVADTVIKEAATIVTPGATVVALQGDLGAGKTTLVQAIGTALGVVDTVTSPTFVVLRQYVTNHPNFSTLLHMDAYRIETLAELAPLHFTDLLAQSENLFCIEWAEKIAPALPRSHIVVTARITERGQHYFTISHHETI